MPEDSGDRTASHHPLQRRPRHRPVPLNGPVKPFREAYHGRGAFASESRPPITTRFVPFARSLSTYSGARLRTDALAGITVAALALPSSMAYAELAGVPVSAGLYALLLPVVAYAVFGSAPRVVVGPEGTVALLVATTVGPLAAAGSGEYATLAAMLGLMVGLVFFAARLVRLGWIADYFSQAVLVGYITGVAVVLILGQIGKLVGISSDEDGAIRETIDIIRHLGEANTATVAGRRAGGGAPRPPGPDQQAHPGRPPARGPRHRRLVGAGPRLPRCGRHRYRAQRTAVAVAAGRVAFGRRLARSACAGHLPRGLLRLDPHGPLLRRPPPRGRRRQPGAARVRRRPGRLGRHPGHPGRHQRVADGRERRHGGDQPDQWSDRRRDDRRHPALPHRTHRVPSLGGPRRGDRVRGVQADRPGPVARTRAQQQDRGRHRRGHDRLRHHDRRPAGDHRGGRPVGRRRHPPGGPTRGRRARVVCRR